MRGSLISLSFALTCTACAAIGPSPAAVEVISQRVTPEDAACRAYYAHVQMDGRMRDITGRACRQSDGSWKVAEGPPENPAQVQTVYTPDAHAVFSTWSNNPPIGISLGRPVMFWTPHEPREGSNFFRAR